MIIQIIGVVGLIIISSLMGVAYGYGQGYEDALLEGMSKKKRQKYLEQKEILKQINRYE